MMLYGRFEHNMDAKGRVFVPVKLREKLNSLLAGYATGKKIKSGVTVAICGKPNTGKSSLLNKLLGYDKAIVSNIAGTTRDAVEGVLEIEGRKFNLYDTAGVYDITDVAYTPFDYRFADECAGVYCTVGLSVPVNGICADTFFDFNEDFNEDFNARGISIY